MSLLGIDVGTTGCKATLFSEEGLVLGSAYQEYDINRPEPGWAELDAVLVLKKVKQSIREAAAQSHGDPVVALAVSSLGEAIVPVTENREVLSASMLNFDVRGEEYVEKLKKALEDEYLFNITGNTMGNNYTLTKLMWFKEYQPELYAKTYKFLHWSSFIAFMLGADPVLDYSLANRSLLFNLDAEKWADEIIELSGLERQKLPDLAPSGTVIGTISAATADELGIPPEVAIATGAHDQCANALGCGVIEEGCAAYSMGTYVCITPLFKKRRPARTMIQRGLNTEHHAVSGLYVCFLFNHGGGLIKWYRDTFAVADYAKSSSEGSSIYAQLFSEMPTKPSSVITLPHFAPTGPPDFIADTCGVVVGLHLDTSRGDILKGILEGTTFYLKESIDTLPSADIKINEYRVVGGGSRSDAWIQICADILNRPFVRPKITEAGTLGAAMLAGLGTGKYANAEEGVRTMVKLDKTFEPNPEQHKRYGERYDKYRRLYPLTKEYLKELHREIHMKGKK